MSKSHNIPIKLLLLIPNLGSGGAQKVFREQYHFLSSKVQVWACAFNLEGALSADLEMNPISLEVPPGQNFFSKAYFFLLRCVRLRRLKKKLQADICISHMEGANYVNFLSSTSKVILVEHGSKVGDVYNRLASAGWFRRKVMLPFIYRHAHRVVAVSEGLRKELENEFAVPGSKITVIPNSFDIQRITGLAGEPLSLEETKIFNRPVMITSGRLHPQKNHAALIRVFAETRKNDSNLCLVILGDGDLMDDLIKKTTDVGLKYATARDWSLDADVYFFGFRDNPFKYLKRAKLFVFSSDFEGFPLALCEAMIFGVPVMSTDCRTGPREILAPGSPDQYEGLARPERAEFGILMPLIKEESSVSCWANEIIKVLEDDKLLKAYSAAGKQRMECFSQPEVLKKWLDLIQ